MESLRANSFRPKIAFAYGVGEEFGSATQTGKASLCH